MDATLYGSIRPALADKPVAGTKELNKPLGSVTIEIPIQLAVRNDEELSKLLGSVARPCAEAWTVPWREVTGIRRRAPTATSYGGIHLPPLGTEGREVHGAGTEHPCGLDSSGSGVGGGVWGPLAARAASPCVVEQHRASARRRPLGSVVGSWRLTEGRGVHGAGMEEPCGVRVSGRGRRWYGAAPRRRWPTWHLGRAVGVKIRFSHPLGCSGT
jgi:hypothetical protein